jgi:hypothetical protein
MESIHSMRRTPPEAAERCLVEGCGRVARKGGRCWGHEKARQRELRRLRAKWGEVDPDEVPQPSRPLGERLPPHERLVTAALRLADVEAEASNDRTFVRAYDRLRKAAVRYVGTLR